MNSPSDPPPSAGASTRTGPIGFTVPRAEAVAPEALPAAVLDDPDARSAAEEMLHRLSVVNHRALPPSSRRDWLEAARAQILPLAARLHDTTDGQPLADTPHQDNAARLLESLAEGYKLLAETSAAAKAADAAELAAILARTLDTLGRRLFLSYCRYSPPPEGTWLEIHRLYRFALRRRVEELKLTDPLRPGESHTLTQAYARLLLMTLANPFSLPPVTLKRLQAQLWSWCDEVRIGPPESGGGRFCVELDQDVAPVPCEPGSTASRELLLDTAPLIRRLSQLLGQAPEDREEWLSTSLLRHLIQMWGEPASARSRRHPRTERSISVEVVLGLEAMHTLLVPRAVGGGRSPAMYSCRTEDSSLGGYRLAWESPAPELQPGMPVALGLLQGNERRWLIGVVRWVQRQSSPAGFALGVQLLAARAEAAQCEDAAATFPCLMLPALPAIGLPRSLLLPGARHRPGDRVVVTLGELRESVRLQEIVSASDSYGQYLLEETA